MCGRSPYALICEPAWPTSPPVLQVTCQDDPKCCWTTAKQSSFEGLAYIGSWSRFVLDGGSSLDFKVRLFSQWHIEVFYLPSSFFLCLFVCFVLSFAQYTT
jgi:pantothenate kinase